MERAKKKITKRVVDGLKPKNTIWDTEVRGFGVRCQRRDKTYVFKLSFQGRQRWISIGNMVRHGQLRRPEMKPCVYWELPPLGQTRLRPVTKSKTT
jgi:hypothetical protein